MTKTVNRTSKIFGKGSPVSGFCTKITAIILVLALCFALAGCQVQNGDEGTVTFVVAKGDNVRAYEINLSDFEQAPTALDILDYLKEKHGVEYKAQEGAYGLYLTRVGEVKEDMANGVYVGIWTSCDADKDVSAYATTKEYNGVTLTSSGVGISSMHFEDGVIVYVGELIYG